MSGNELPTTGMHGSPVTTSSLGTSALRTERLSERSRDKQERRAQCKAADAAAKKARRTIANCLELMMPALADMPDELALKASCEILRRVSALAATIAARVHKNAPLQLDLVADEEDEE